MRTTKLTLFLGSVLFAGCAGGGDDDKDTDAPVDTDPVETDDPDTDVEDTDLQDSDTDLPPLDTDVLESFLPGTWDEGFVMPGFTGESAARVLDTARLPDGRLVAAGIFDFVTDVAAPGVAVRETDGTWSVLGGGIEAAVEAVLVTSEGTVLAAGWSSGFIGVDAGVWRLDGASWTRIGTLYGGRAHALYEADDGTVFVGGGFSATEEAEAIGLAVWDADSESFVPFAPGLGSDGWATVRSFFAWPDQDFCVAGHFSEVDGKPAGGTACYEADAGWTTLGSLPGEAYGVEVLGNGRVLAYGGFALGDPPDAFVIGLAEYEDGAWVEPAELGVDGGLTITVRALLPDGTDGYYIAGQFGTAGVYAGSGKPGPATANLAHFDGSAFSPVGVGIVPTTGIFAADVEGGHHLRRDDDGSVLIGGLFQQADGLTGSGLAAWDGAAMSLPYATPAHLGLEGGGIALGVAPGGSVWLVAEVAAHAHVPSLFTWDGTGFTDLHSGPSGYVSDIATVPGKLYVSGHLEGFGLDLCDVAAYDGRKWTCLITGLADGGAAPGVKALAADGQGRLALIGEFTVGGSANVAWFDGTDVQPLGDGLAGNPSQVVIDPATGDVYVSGFGMSPFVGLAWWDASASAWKDVGTGVDGSVRDIAWWQGELVVGGAWLSVPEGDDLPPLLTWDGADFTELGPVLGDFSGVFTVKAIGDDLFVWGDVPGIGDATDSTLYHTEDGVTWTALGVGTDDIVSDVAVGTDAVWVTGPFLKAGGKPSFGVARWVPAAP